MNPPIGALIYGAIILDSQYAWRFGHSKGDTPVPTVEIPTARKQSVDQYKLFFNCSNSDKIPK